MKTPDDSYVELVYERALKGMDWFESTRGLPQGGMGGVSARVRSAYGAGRSRYARSLADDFQGFQVPEKPGWSDFPKPRAPLITCSNRWVPCDGTRVLCRWSKVAYDMETATLLSPDEEVAENLKGCSFIVVDVDGFHGGVLKTETIRTFAPFRGMTSSLDSPTTCFQVDPDCPEDIALQPVSFHLDFMVDRLVPTMHFPNAGVDILGNMGNQIRFFKDKLTSELPEKEMTDTLWDLLMGKVWRLEGTNE